MTVEQHLPAESLVQAGESKAIQPEYIPAELFHWPHWVCWRYVDRGQDRKPDKQPVNPRTLHNAGVHWQNTWAPFALAYQTYLAYRNNIHGIGFVLTSDDPYVAVDLDGCVQGQALEEQAARLVRTLNSYCEVSPSGQGLRILVASPEFGANHRQPGLEVYAQRRYVTITGHHLVETPTQIAIIPPDQLTSLLPQPIAEPQSPHAMLPKSAHSAVAGPALWERIFAHDRFGEQHLRRFQGDLSLDGGDHSLTIIRLLNCLARWTQGDAVQMRQLILLSPLANAKWFEKRGTGDWLDYQIADAIIYVAGRKRHV